MTTGERDSMQHTNAAGPRRGRAWAIARRLAPALLLGSLAPTAGAQRVTAPFARRPAGDAARSAAERADVEQTDAERASAVATTAALIVAGAAGTQLLGTPDAWPRTWGGFARRVGDQTGFYVAQTSVQHGLGRATGLATDTRPCARAGLIGCALRRTFTARDAAGRPRVHVPFIASVAAATGVSLAWRPERRDGGDAAAFLATRLAVVYGGYVAERVLVDWWASRRAAVAR
jgi:hypothetical protein